MLKLGGWIKKGPAIVGNLIRGMVYLEFEKICIENTVSSERFATEVIGALACRWGERIGRRAKWYVPYTLKETVQ